MVRHQHVAGAECRALKPDLCLDRLAHGPQVHGQVGRVGDQLPFGPKQGAGKIEPFLDVGGDGCLLEHPPICSAMDMNRLAKIESWTGSTAIPGFWATVLPTWMAMSPAVVISARQSGSIRMVEVSWMTMAGPKIFWPALRFSRMKMSVSWKPPSK